jgi:lipopolysaccharide/colanic/teichoic acid biosynthesis glycosyltransferase
LDHQRQCSDLCFPETGSEQMARRTGSEILPLEKYVTEIKTGRHPEPLSKRILDVFLASVLLVLASPVMLLVALLVRLTSCGPALYNQVRLGRSGKPFRIYKFRTMWHNCEKHSGAQWSRPGDSRITPVGRILRLSHLDELPQLFNVLLGHMSLVGPRPERPEFVPLLTQSIPNYTNRLAVRPGVTGLAQVQLPADTDLESVRRKLIYDLWYIENRSLWLDIRLIACTAFKMLLIPERHLCRIFLIPGRDQVESAPVQTTVTSNGVLPAPTTHGLPELQLEAMR